MTAAPVALPLIAAYAGGKLIQSGMNNAEAIRLEKDPIKKQALIDEKQKSWLHRDLFAVRREVV